MRLLSPLARARRSALFLALLSGVATGCSFLVEFVDREADEVVGLDGSPDGPTTSIVVGRDGGVGPNPGADGGGTDGSTADSDVPFVDTGPPTCVGKANGTPFPGSSVRCCNNAPTNMLSDTNCGACGLQCNTAAGHHCIEDQGHHYCAGCALDGGGGNGACFSSCCYVGFVFDLRGGVCAPASPCVEPFPPYDNGGCNGSCASAAPGSVCKRDGNDGNYCSYP